MRLLIFFAAKDADKTTQDDPNSEANAADDSTLNLGGMIGGYPNISSSHSILKPPCLDGEIRSQDALTTKTFCLFPNNADEHGKKASEKTSVQKIYYANKQNDNLSKSTMNTIQSWWQDQIDYDSCNEDD